MGGNVFYFWGQHRPGSPGGEAWPTPHYITANHKIYIQHSFMEGENAKYLNSCISVKSNLYSIFQAFIPRGKKINPRLAADLKGAPKFSACAAKKFSQGLQY